ncbi:hypothetical protein ABIB40_003327 [Pedobacter sp. UYP30]
MKNKYLVLIFALEMVASGCVRRTTHTVTKKDESGFNFCVLQDH